MTALADLMEVLPQTGVVEWIGLRPAKRQTMAVVDEVMATAAEGLIGDRNTRPSGKRQVTLIQAEHLAAVASMLGVAEISPDVLRRNIVVRGINLLALKNRRFGIGEAVLEHTGPCHPCSRMEAALGPGGYNALRGHGGITARVVQDGLIRLRSEVRMLLD